MRDGSLGRAWIEVDREALRHNVKVLRSLLPEECELMPAVKANAYGHGALLVAGELNRMGIHAFCVACVEEGVQLRKGGIQGEILVLGYTHPGRFPLLQQYHLSQTVVDYAYALEMEKYGGKLEVHIGIDTGMHRLGEHWEHIEQLCGICRMKNLVIKGAYTHLCVADSMEQSDREFTRKQAEAFYRVIHRLQERGYKIPKLHLQASSGVLHYPELAEDYARVGIALYGACGETGSEGLESVGLKPVLSLKARVASVRELLPGEAAGYGLAYVAECPARLAVLTIGYGDGLPRMLSCGAGEVLVSGSRAPIVGRICMDQTLVDVTGLEVHSGEIAVLIGSSGDDSLSVEEMSDRVGTIPNEILSRLGERLERICI